MQVGVGKEGNFYSDSQNVTSREIPQHLGLYIFHWLVLLPKLSNKLKSQTEDIIHERDFIMSSFNHNFEKQQKNFKAFFSVQGPSVDIPSRDELLNWKVRPLLEWIIFLFT